MQKRVTVNNYTASVQKPGRVSCLGLHKHSSNPFGLLNLPKHFFSDLFHICLCCPVVSWRLASWRPSFLCKHLLSWVAFQRMQLDVFIEVNLGICMVMYLVAHSENLSIVKN